MAASVPLTTPAGTRRDHTFHPVRIARVVRETDDARSFVLDIPDELRAAFAYEAGQFCTFRAVVDGEAHVRCYSMSSAPGVDDDLQVTVKRVPGGVVSGWMIDSLAAGDTVDVAPPTGFFQLTPDDGDLVAFAAGSGITPIMSLVKVALATTERRVRLLYANRDRASVIFEHDLDELAATYADRVTVVHHFDVDNGFVGPEAAASLLVGAERPTSYVCGPTPFMDIVEHALLDGGIDAERIHIERFTPGGPAVAPLDAPDDTDDGGPTRVTIELDGRTETTDHHPGTTILQAARQVGMSPPTSCEAGSCATCMARVVEGSATMHVNNALTPDEVDDGWVLTCQAVPTSSTVHVVYGYD